MAEHYHGCEITLEGGRYVVRKDGVRKGSFPDKTAGPYLEMFSRRARLGWDTWGDEALHGTELVA